MAASQLIKDVPKTLLDMSDAVTQAAPYTNADGSFTNAGEVVEVGLWETGLLLLLLYVHPAWPVDDRRSFVIPIPPSICLPRPHRRPRRRW